MTGLAWIFFAAWAVMSACYVIVALDARAQRERARRLMRGMSALMHAYGLLALSRTGHGEVIDLTDLDDAKTIADTGWSK